MNRWERLEAVAGEFEAFGRKEERERWTDHVAHLQAKLEALQIQACELKQALDSERDLNLRLEEENLELRTRVEEAESLRHKWTRFQLMEKHRQFQDACKIGDSNAIRQLLEPPPFHQSNENFVNDLKNAGLRFACASGSLEAIQILLQAGADPSSVDMATKRTCLHFAVTSPGSSDQVLSLLLSYEWCVQHINDLDSERNSALSLAVTLFAVDRILILLSFGGDATLVSKEDWKRLNDFHLEEQHQQQQQQQEDQNNNENDLEKLMEKPPLKKEKNSKLTPTPKKERNEDQQDAVSLQPSIANKSPPHPSSFKNSLDLDKEFRNLEYLSNQALELYQNGEFADALRIYSSIEQQAAKIWSKENRGTLFYNAAKTCSKLGFSADALEWCEKLLALFPESREGLIERANCRMKLLEYSRAAIDYQNLASLFQEEEEKWLDMFTKARSRADQLENHYVVLGLDSNANQSDIRKAFLKLCLLWHPDKNRTTKDDEVRAGIMFKCINQAHSVLIDDVKRREYDLTLEQSSRGAQSSFFTSSTCFPFPAHFQYQNMAEKTRFKYYYSYENATPDGYREDPSSMNKDTDARRSEFAANYPFKSTHSDSYSGARYDEWEPKDEREDIEPGNDYDELDSSDVNEEM